MRQCFNHERNSTVSETTITETEYHYSGTEEEAAAASVAFGILHDLAADEIAGQLSMRQLEVLAYVIENKPPTMKSAADAIGIRQDGLTKAANALRARGLITQDAGSTDRRHVVMMPTPIGYNTIARMHDIFARYVVPKESIDD
jgi:DNA-binding MarR family transcriptional regulator